MPPTPVRQKIRRKAVPGTARKPPADAAAGSLWRSIADQLRDDITAGRVVPGQRLPNEQTLADRFRVNRHTLRQAVQALVEEGHLHVRQGSGTFVRPVVLDYALQRRTRLTEHLSQSGADARREILSHGEATADTWAEPLKIPRRSRVIVLRTRALVRGRPIGLTTSVYPCPRFSGIAAQLERHGNMNLALVEFGIADYNRFYTVVSARLPTQAEADDLARPAGQPVLVVEYVNVDGTGTPIETGTTLFAADAIQLLVSSDEVA